MSDASRDRSTLQAWSVAALGAVVLAFVAPIGLASAEAVDLAAASLGARRSFGESSPLADLLVRLFALIPVGEVGVRPQALAAAAGILTLALLALRKADPEELVAGRLGAVMLLALSRPFLDVATLRPATAIDLALSVAGVRLLSAVRADGGASRAGLGLAFVCGLAAGAGWPVRAVLWPLGALLTLRSLRRGHRWSLLGPTVFVAGLLPMFGAVVVASAPLPTVVQVVKHLFAVPAHPPATMAVFSSAVMVVGEDVGVLAVLVVALGLLALVRRPPAGIVLAVVSWAAVVAAAVTTGEVALARVVLVAALGTPVAAGVGSLAAVFGRARDAVALVIVVVAVVPAAWVGIGSALAVPSRRTPAALARRLDAAPGAGPPGVGPAVVSGADAAVALRWWRYRTAIGAAPR